MLHPTLAPLYHAVDARRLSREARDAAGLTRADFVYGEFPASELLSLLEGLPLREGGVFLDLGAGVGQVVLTAALTGRFAEVRGVELIPALCAVSRQCAAALLETQPTLPLPLPRIVLEEGDLCSVDLSSVDVVFAYATCFSDALCERIAARSLVCRPGTWFLSVTRPLDAPLLAPRHTFSASLPWGTSTVWTYQRLDASLE